MISLLLLLSTSIIFGCTCDSIMPFAKNIDKETSIIQIQILKHGLLPVDQIRKIKFDHEFKGQNLEMDSIPTPPLPPFDFMSYTVLKVLNKITQGPTSDTIVFFNGSGVRCLGSLASLKTGENYILRISDKSKLEFDADIKTHLAKSGLKNMDWWHRDIFTNGICYEWLLDIEDGIVKGNITQNIRLDLLREFRQTNDALTEDEREEKLQLIRETNSEEMLFSDFVNLINNN